MAEKAMCMSTQITDDEDTQRENNIRGLTMLGHFGFECLPHQLVNRAIQKGFSFNILCVGETGLGKSTLIDALFNTNLKEKKSSHFNPSVELKIRTYELQESNVQLKLTVVKTVGYGDQMNKEDSHQPIVGYLDAQFESYFQEELKIQRSFADYHDSRVHVCLYFISPTGHSLKSLDLLTLKSIDNKKHLPFAVVGCIDEVKVGKRMVRGRQYPWGVLQVDNENHCDFVKLRDMLLCTNTEDLKEQTHTQHYERYRCFKLQKIGFTDVGPDNQPVSFQEIYEAKRQEFCDQCQREEEELKKKFMQRVKEREIAFKEAEKELQDKFEHLKRIQHEETVKLEEEKRQLEEEMMNFYKMKAGSETPQTPGYTNIKKDKDRKK
ncbi:septin-14 isoform X2 [Artibeus jamaicensis]|uniref:septin-14 isoform X2 n=1 Tax=Artibeus jamaicensis TaxID=9417 RepID=UPI00235B0948|nr:septin-14 isoform X2 [Artibeus jamaicensis]